MKLTKEQTDNLLKLVTISKPTHTCPICGSQLFGISDTIHMLIECTGKTLVLGQGQSFSPVFTASCEKCGYTFLINALKSGIITDKDLEV